MSNSNQNNGAGNVGGRADNDVGRNRRGYHYAALEGRSAGSIACRSAYQKSLISGSIKRLWRPNVAVLCSSGYKPKELLSLNREKPWVERNADSYVGIAPRHNAGKLKNVAREYFLSLVWCQFFVVPLIGNNPRFVVSSFGAACAPKRNLLAVCSDHFDVTKTHKNLHIFKRDYGVVRNNERGTQ